MSLLWQGSSPRTKISLVNPVSYADRLRIRHPGDASFALGPHIDGGSVERWEPDGYGRGGVYDKIFEGDWESYDPWDVSTRVDAVNNKYDGIGPCTMFRMWQGWLSMSQTGPKEGTLLVNPLMKMATSYVLLRPFFRPKSDSEGPLFLDEGNWEFIGPENMTSELQGARPGTGQELTDELHPHLELNDTMIHVPPIKPGDYVAWHCDSELCPRAFTNCGMLIIHLFSAIHAVDKVHAGKGDSSVMYIPVCPVTETNVEYLARQRQAFRDGTPGPDFPGGLGESNHVDRPREVQLQKWTNDAGLGAMGLSKFDVREDALPGEREVLIQANETLGFR